MSFILDALRRAEAERQSGQVPGLHDAAAAPVVATAPAARGALPWAVGLPAMALGVAALAWWWWPTPAAAPPAVTTAATPVATAPQRDAAPAEPSPAPLPVVVSAPPAPPAPVPAASAPATAAPRPMRFTELAPELQRQMPPLVPSGSVWSDSATARFVIINGQVLREGDAVAPGLVLERIQPKAAWLRWRGMLVELPL
jgi:general secretion pathway protein B